MIWTKISTTTLPTLDKYIIASYDINDTTIFEILKRIEIDHCTCDDCHKKIDKYQNQVGITMPTPDSWSLLYYPTETA